MLLCCCHCLVRAAVRHFKSLTTSCAANAAQWRHISLNIDELRLHGHSNKEIERNPPTPSGITDMCSALPPSSCPHPGAWKSWFRAGDQNLCRRARQIHQTSYEKEVPNNMAKDLQNGVPKGGQNKRCLETTSDKNIPNKSEKRSHRILDFEGFAREGLQTSQNPRVSDHARLRLQHVGRPPWTAPERYGPLWSSPTHVRTL